MGLLGSYADFNLRQKKTTTHHDGNTTSNHQTTSQNDKTTSPNDKTISHNNDATVHYDQTPKISRSDKFSRPKEE